MNDTIESQQPPATGGSKIKWFVIAAVVGGLVVLSLYIDLLGGLKHILDWVQAGLKLILEWIQGLGFVGAFVFILLYIAAAVFLIPGSLLTLGAGAIYGIGKGSILVSIASTLGAAAAFLVGRYLARDWIASKIEKYEKFRAIDEAVAKEGWKIVGLTRLSPAFPYTFLNYAFGFTKVPFKGYFFATWIGMLPATVMYVYFGALAGSLATLGAEEQSAGAAGWIIKGLGLAATVVVTVVVTRIASRALGKRVDDSETT